jgi:hypothetical protein
MSAGINIATKLPYKVFTALLTQSGVEDKQKYIVNFGEVPGRWPQLPIGTTLVILQNGSKSDFTISGAPNNIAGTWFIYNGIPPKIFTPERAGKIIDIGYDLGAPVATVLENTIGNIWFTYARIGNYAVNSNGLFTENKTTFSIILMGDDLENGFLCKGYIQEPNSCGIVTGDISAYYDNVLNWKTPIEIKVYN